MHQDNLRYVRWVTRSSLHNANHPCITEYGELREKLEHAGHTKLGSNPSLTSRQPAGSEAPSDHDERKNDDHVATELSRQATEWNAIADGE